MQNKKLTMNSCMCQVYTNERNLCTVFNNEVIFLDDVKDFIHLPRKFNGLIATINVIGNLEFYRPKLSLGGLFREVELVKVLGKEGESNKEDIDHILGLLEAKADKNSIVQSWGSVPSENKIPSEKLVYKTILENNSKSSSYDLEDSVEYSIPLATSKLPLFTPMYWTVVGQRTSSYSIITNSYGSNKYIEVNAILRSNKDLVGVLWESFDKLSHKNLKRNTLIDYSGTVFKFSLETSDSIDNIQLAIRTDKIIPDHVDLSAYVVNEEGGVYDIVIDFDTVKGGSAQTDSINVESISNISFIISSDGYSKEDEFSPYGSNVEVKILISNIECNKTIDINGLNVVEHKVSMCTSYDDDMQFSPEYIVNSILKLGYTSGVNHYCGMSTYYNKIWNSTENRFRLITDGSTGTINLATRAWHLSYAELLKKNDIPVIFSISYELFSESCPYEWTQRDWFDEFGVTGYTPPSYLLSPCNDDAMNWLKEVFIEFADILNEAGQKVRMQIGEPWWWWNQSTRRPCIYDYSAKLKFNNLTGLYAQEIPSIDSTNLDSTDLAYLAFLENELGMSVINIKNHVLAKYPDSESAPLIFLPSIVDPAVGIMTKVNYPKELWKSPEFPFIQTEVYDWLIRDKLGMSLEAFTRATDELEYLPEQVHYLAGFVPSNELGKLVDPSYDLQLDASRLWGNILFSINEANNRGIFNTYIWAFQQVMRDSVIFTSIVDRNIDYESTGILPELALYARGFKVVASKLE